MVYYLNYQLFNVVVRDASIALFSSNNTSWSRISQKNKHFTESNKNVDIYFCAHDAFLE